MGGSPLCGEHPSRSDGPPNPSRSDGPPRWCGEVSILLLAALAAFGSGCQRSLKPIFEELHPQLVWPANGQPDRIRYVGQLSSSADLKPAPRPFEALGLILGSKEAAPFYGPRSAVRSRDGRWLWVADPGGRCVHVLDLERRGYDKLTGTVEAMLLCPVDVCLGPGPSVYVCDSEAAAIYRLDQPGRTVALPVRTADELKRPAALFWDEAQDELYVVDIAAHDIKVLDAGGVLRRILGRRGDAPGEFNFPCDITGDGDAIWVVDAGNHRVQKLTRDGEPLAVFGQAGDALGDLALPKGIALDGDGHVYVVDARFENVQIFDRSGELLLTFGQEGTGPGEFWLPAGIFIDPSNRVWICDSYNRRVQVFDYLPESSERGP